MVPVKMPRRHHPGMAKRVNCRPLMNGAAAASDGAARFPRVSPRAFAAGHKQTERPMPDHPQEQKQNILDDIRRTRNRLFVCFLTLPVSMYVVMQMLNAGRDSTLLMYAYMLLYAFFGIATSVKRCPQCGGQFFVKRFFLNPFRARCAHCGQALGQQR
jgi:hypothetical protein